MIEHSYNADPGKCPDCGMEIKSGVVNKTIEDLKDQTYRFISNELSTVESIMHSR